MCTKKVWFTIAQNLAHFVVHLTPFWHSDSGLFGKFEFGLLTDRDFNIYICVLLRVAIAIVRPYVYASVEVHAYVHVVHGR